MCNVVTRYQLIISFCIIIYYLISYSKSNFYIRGLHKDTQIYKNKIFYFFSEKISKVQENAKGSRHRLGRMSRSTCWPLLMNKIINIFGFFSFLYNYFDFTTHFQCIFVIFKVILYGIGIYAILSVILKTFDFLLNSAYRVYLRIQHLLKVAALFTRNNHEIILKSYYYF